ncbi:MAG: hypothetical protein RI897_2068 [Verrucomicrobiota bacterium]|jgi:hypothetical protein
MIQLNSDALVFATARGELIPCSVESVAVELVGESAAGIDPHLLRQAASAVLHHFKVECHKTCVTVGEFAEALAKVLRGFGLDVRETIVETNPVPGPTIDLRTLASGPDGGAELFFFSRLRTSLRSQLADSPDAVRYSGLRSCVKRLAGARRWSHRCQKLQDQIVDSLRSWFDHEAKDHQCMLVVR